MKLRDAIKQGNLEAVEQAIAKDRSCINMEIQGLQDDALLPVLQVMLKADPPSYALGSAVVNAAMSGAHALLRTLLAHPGALTPESGFRSLGHAASHGQLESVRMLLAAGAAPNPLKENTSHRDNEEHPLVKAVEEGHEDIVRALLAAGARFDFLIGDAQERILDLAKRKSTPGVVSLLQEAGARERTDEDLDLPSAASFGKQKRVEALLPAATVEQRGHALAMAAQAGHLALVELLLASGTPKDSRDSSLYYASQNGHEAVVEALLAAGANPDARMWSGRTPLMVAAYNGYVKIVERLLAAGADACARTDDGDTVLDEARRRPEIVALLLKAGADPKERQKRVAAVKRQLKKLERPAWTPRVGGATSGPLGSRFGGLPWLEDGERWPLTQDGQPLAFLLQVNLDEAPEEARAQTGGGLLQLFLDTEAMPYHAFSPGHFVRIVEAPTSKQGSVAKAPEGLKPFPERAILDWKQVVDRPFREAGPKPHHRYPVKLPEHADEIAFRLNVKEDKLGGWASWVQDPHYPKERGGDLELDRLLFQLNSEQHVPVMLGDNGVGYVLQSSREPRRVAFMWQCG